jgi:hypothetical protein
VVSRAISGHKTGEEKCRTGAEVVDIGRIRPIGFVEEIFSRDSPQQPNG